MITEIQSRLHHFRACRESRAPDMKRLSVIAKKTEENNVTSVTVNKENHLYATKWLRMIVGSLTDKNS